MGSLATKKDFAAELGVTPGRLSQYIADGKIGGAAIVGSGVRAQINVDIAKGQLRKNLDVSQSTGMNAKARLGPQKRPASAVERSYRTKPASETGPDLDPPHVEAGPKTPVDEGTVEDQIKQARLAQLDLANDKARAEAALRAGRYVKAEDSRQEMGRVAARLLAVMESSLAEMANALAADPSTSPRDTLRALRTAWRSVRARAAKAIGAEAGAIEPLIDEEEAA